MPPYYPDTPLVREELARMYDNIADMDGQVGEILKQLEDDGLAENTIVFYWSDHGDGVPRAKRSLYDSGLRVPLMIRWPKTLGRPGAPGPVSDELVSFIDLAPTVLALAGVEIPTHLQGRVLLGPHATPAPEFVFAARDRMDIEYDMMRSARDARFLYIRNFAPELPYAGHIIYRNQSAIMQEWLRLQAEGKLTGPAALWMRTSGRRRSCTTRGRSAPDPRSGRGSGASRDARAHAQGRHRLDGAHRRSGPHQRGRDDSADVARRRPARNGAALHRAATDDRRPARQESMAIKAPTEVVIYVPTQGASIGYTTEDGPTPKWRLYTGPILVTADDAPRQGHPLRLQGKRGNTGDVHEVHHVLNPALANTALTDWLGLSSTSTKTADRL